MVVPEGWSKTKREPQARRPPIAAFVASCSLWTCPDGPRWEMASNRDRVDAAHSHRGEPGQSEVSQSVISRSHPPRAQSPPPALNPAPPLPFNHKYREREPLQSITFQLCRHPWQARPFLSTVSWCLLKLRLTAVSHRTASCEISRPARAPLYFDCPL